MLTTNLPWLAGRIHDEFAAFASAFAAFATANAIRLRADWLKHCEHDLLYGKTKLCPCLECQRLRRSQVVSVLAKSDTADGPRGIVPVYVQQHGRVLRGKSATHAIVDDCAEAPFATATVAVAPGSALAVAITKAIAITNVRRP